MCPACKCTKWYRCSSDPGVASSVRSDGGFFFLKGSCSKPCAESLGRMSFKPLCFLVFRACYTYLAVDVH